MAEINCEKWEKESQLTVEEAMNLISGFEPGTYKFCFANEIDMPPDSVDIYKALVNDLNNFKDIFMYIDGEKADYRRVCELVYLYDENFCWWSKGTLQVDDLKRWLRSRGIKSFFFNTHRINITGEFLPKEWLTESPPEQEFCVSKLVPIGAVTLLVAHGGTGKSLFALKMAIHIVLGLPIIGAETKSGNVAYMSLEDSKNIVRERLFQFFNKLPEANKQIDELASKFMIIDRYGLQTHMATKEYSTIKIAPIAYDLTALLRKHKIKCVFVDTFIRTNTLNENDNAEMGALLVAFEGIAKQAECAVVLIHHLPKAGTSRAYAARGASAITDNSRSALHMEKVDDKDADKFTEDNIKTAVREGRLLRLTHTKHNYSAAHSEQYLEMTTDGILLEVTPASFSTSDINFIIKQRYKELFDWYMNVWKRESLTKTNIDENVNSIRPANTGYGKETYKRALDWAIQEQYAKQVPAPKDGSSNTRAMYYTLVPIQEQQPTEPSNNPPIKN